MFFKNNIIFTQFVHGISNAHVQLLFSPIYITDPLYTKTYSYSLFIGMTATNPGSEVTEPLPCIIDSAIDAVVSAVMSLQEQAAY